VSPWFPLLLLVFPIFETIFSIYRRKVVLGLSPGQPDRYHMHQVIYASLPGGTTVNLDSEQLVKGNSKVAPYLWLMSVCCAVPALVFWKETSWLVSVSLVFCIGYVLLYRRLARAGSES
jgi:UDP-N-acetylmuramyl pentapeptide phosphotransferase/UDP-N-acetylglucosamine-1-phosphate transferase